MPRALPINTHCDGVARQNPAIQLDEESKVWFLGAKNPGANRFRSFRELLEQRVLANQYMAS